MVAQDEMSGPLGTIKNPLNPDELMLLAAYREGATETIARLIGDMPAPAPEPRWPLPGTVEQHTRMAWSVLGALVGVGYLKVPPEEDAHTGIIEVVIDALNRCI